ncbi:hypothetical protein HPB50_022034 [Hyalomma asiaticum]|uniref:Uncharacterized protein n=1 Tax=Hyalomma asiaticum TaxID=266040 RepID=A0ACB7SZ90_HYAAI|nr:hypothetical protein HPB50_022034 [Hyalomma asiaticum]
MRNLKDCITQEHAITEASANAKGSLLLGALANDGKHRHLGVLYKNAMPTLEGYISGRKVTVLRDTGSNTAVVKRSLVPDRALTGKTGRVILADGTSLELPEAWTYLSTPYYTGKLLVRCMNQPMYEVIVGNIPGACDAHDPDPKWRYGTRQHSTNIARGGPQEKNESVGVEAVDRKYDFLASASHAKLPVIKGEMQSRPEGTGRMKKNIARFFKRHNCRCYGKTTKKQDPEEEDMALVSSPTTQSKPCLELTGPLSGAGIKREPGVVRQIVSQVESPSREMLKELYEIPSDKKLDETSASLAVEDGAYEHATACIDLKSAKVREGELAKTLSPARQQSVDSCSEPGLLYPTSGGTRLQKAQCGFPEPPCQRGTFFTCADRNISQTRFAHGCGGKDDEVIPGTSLLRRRLYSDVCRQCVAAYMTDQEE